MTLPGTTPYRLPSSRAARPDRLAGFARLYAALAVFVVVLSCQPMFERPDGTDDAGRPLPSLWAELSATGHPASVIAVLLLVLLTGALLLGAFDVRAIAVPVGILVGALLLVVLVLARPGYGTPTPALSSWGQAAVLLGALGIVLCIAHIVLLRRGSPAPDRIAVQHGR